MPVPQPDPNDYLSTLLNSKLGEPGNNPLKSRFDFAEIEPYIAPHPDRDVRRKFAELAIERNFFSEKKSSLELSEMLSKYASFPTFFSSMVEVFENKRTSQSHCSDFYFALTFTGLRAETMVVQLLELTKDLAPPKVFDAVWSQFKNGNHEDPTPNAFTFGSSKTQFEVGTWYKMVLPICQRVIAAVGESVFYSCYDFPFYRLILAKSSEPERDLRLHSRTVSKPPGYKFHTLKAYYEAGHHYISHLDYFGPYQYDFQEKTKIPPRELTIRTAFAKQKHYPPLAEQEKLLPHLINFDASMDTSIVALVTRAMEENIELRGIVHVSALCSSLDQESLKIAVRALGALTQPHLSQLPARLALFEEVLRTNPQRLEETAQAFENGEFSQLERDLYREKLAEHQLKFTEKPLGEVYKAFLTPETPDSELVSEDSLVTACAEYERILARGKDLLKFSRGQLEALAARNSAALKTSIEEDASIKSANRIEFFAITRELFKSHYGVYPYNTQIISALLLSVEPSDPDQRMTYAQIKTGEGKSLLFAMLSAYQASQGRNVEVITSNSYLADRDNRRFAPFFESLGLTCASMPEEGKGKLPDSDTNIIYATNSQLIFEHLRARLNGSQLLHGKRFDVALIDEADNLCLDLSSETCRIASVAAGRPKKFYQDLITFIDQDLGHGPVRDIQTLVSELLVRSPQYRSINPVVLSLYLLSAHRSRELQKDVDFVVDRGEVVIIDHGNTERRKERSQWDSGLHEFMALRQGLELPTSTAMSAQMSHPTFLRKYQKLLCISGTFGDDLDRAEIQELYHAKGFDGPTHLRSRRIDRPMQLFLNREEQLAHVIAKTAGLTKAEKPRPLLIICQSIKESELVAHHLSSHGFPCRILNDHLNRDESGAATTEQAILSSAGIPGTITIATSVAGRGADIIPTAESIEAGGLYSLLTFVPANQRVDLQARGRAGRQGAPGVSEVVAALSEDSFLGRFSDPERLILAKTVQSYGNASIEIAKSVDFMRRAHNQLGQMVRKASLLCEQQLEGLFEEHIARSTKAAETLNQENEFIRSTPGLAWFLVSGYVGQTWASQYQELESSLRYQDILHRATDQDGHWQSSNSENIQKLNAMFKKSFGLSISEIQRDPDDQLSQFALSLYVLYAQNIAWHEARLSTLKKEALLPLLGQLEQSVDLVTTECVGKFSQADRFSIELWVRRELEQREAIEKKRKERENRPPASA